MILYIEIFILGYVYFRSMNKTDLIKRNTVDIVGDVNKLLKEKKKPVVYLGTAITGRPHVAYFVWVLKLADFLRAGFKVKLLFCIC